MFKRFKSIPMVLVGNKLDMEETKNKVSLIEAKDFAKNNKMDFFETSAKENVFVESLFHQVVRKIIFASDTVSQIKFKFCGKGIEKILKLENVEIKNCEIPSINKNLKNVWMLIFKMVLPENKKQRLNCKLVCKHWYSLITKNFEKKIISLLKTYKSNIIFHYSSQNNDLWLEYYNKYVFFFDICDYLNNSPQDVIKKNNISFQNSEKFLVILYNTQQLYNQLEKSRNFIFQYFSDWKSYWSISSQFSSFNVMSVEDLSGKNIEKIFKKLNL